MRPEKIWLEELEPEMVETGKVVERVYVGTTTQGMTGSGQRTVALEQNTARRSEDDRRLIGDDVRFGWHPEHELVLR